MTRPLELGYAVTAPRTGARILSAPGRVTITTSPEPLWEQTVRLTLKGIATLVMATPMVLALVLASHTWNNRAELLAAAAFGFIWVLVLWRFWVDLRDFQCVTVLDATPGRLTWRRHRNDRGRQCLIPREQIRDIALQVVQRNFRPGIDLYVQIKLVARPAKLGIPHEATTVFLARNDFAVAFEAVDRLRDALNISAATMAAR